MRNAHLKDTFRELWNNKSRFLAIFAIIALGTGFFAGVKVTSPDMKLTADTYFEDYSLMDIHLISTYGFNEGDLNAIKANSGIRGILPAYSMDAIIKTDNEDKVAKVHSISLDELKNPGNGYINRVRLTGGRLPEKSGECVVEKMDKIGGVDLKLGDTIRLNTGKEDKDISDYLKKDTYTVVGYVETPYYLTFEKGTSSLGNGTVSGYVMIPDEDFNMEVFTDVFLTLKSTEGISAFADSYKNSVESGKDQFEDIAAAREEKRYEEVYNEAEAKLNDAKEKLAEGEKKQKEELAKALDKLEKGEAELVDGRRTLESQEASYRQKISDGSKRIAQEQARLESGEKEYAAQLLLFNQNKAGMPPEQAAAAEMALNMTRAQLDAGAGELAAQKVVLDKSEAQGRDQLAAAGQKLDRAEKDLKAGREEYEKQKAESDSQLEDARKEISDSEQKISEIAKPKWYVNDRNSNPGYSSYADDAKRIDAISTIFPVFFFIVAAFVCLTTMTRMVEEQRTQIGTLKALGYGNFAIASKYLVYAAIASVAGSALGLAVGLKLFPFVIINAYRMLYRLPPTIMPFRADYISLITLGALACTSLAVYLACYKELLENPAALMRPKSPKMGKRVLLERIPFIWSRLKFFSKVTVRNLFRYKKRMVMTLLGVAGCTSLMLAGFGLRDAISSIVPKQYGEVFRFNSIIIIDENSKAQDKNDVYKALGSDEDIDDMLNVRFKNYEAGYEGDWQKINLMVPESPDNIGKFISLHEMHGKKPIGISDEGVVIGEKLSEILDLKAGDELTIRDGDFKSVSVRIAAINENYTLHYVYMSPSLYEKEFGEKYASNCILVKTKGTSQQIDDKISSGLVKNKAVLQMSFTRDNRKSFSDMVGNLGSVVFVLIISAGALAFVVLYNLTNINITERVREIASIKVLGFYDLEVSEYVFRENLILTLLNTVIGLLGGIVLNKFVLETTEIDMIMFGREIYWYSYVASAALTVAFSALVNIVMHFKLKRISMIESLKSVE